MFQALITWHKRKKKQSNRNYVLYRVGFHDIYDDI